MIKGCRKDILENNYDYIHLVAESEGFMMQQINFGYLLVDLSGKYI